MKKKNVPQKNAVFSLGDINRAAWVGFDAGFMAGQSGKFKTSRDAWEFAHKEVDRLRKQLAQKE